MDAEQEHKVIRIITRHDHCLRRVARMLAADSRGDALPADAEFHEHELKSLDANAADLAVELSGSVPNETDWMPPVRFAYRHGYMKPGPMTWLKAFEQGLRLSKRYFESFLAQSQREVHVGDKINVGAAHVVMGSNATAGDITTQGAVSLGEAVSVTDLIALADELAALRKALRTENRDDDIDGDADIGAIALAEKAARAGEKDKMLSALKSVGTWAFDVATKIGVNLASSALKSASGLGS